MKRRWWCLPLLFALNVSAAEPYRPCADEACVEPSPAPTPAFPSAPPSHTDHSGGEALPPMEDDVQLSPSRVTLSRENYPSGELLSERRLFDGKPDGLGKDYYKNGQVMNEWNYSLGLLQGPSRSYYRNGDIKTEWNYKKGKLNGEVRHYHARKILKSVETYKDGSLVDKKDYNVEGLSLEKSR